MRENFYPYVHIKILITLGGSFPELFFPTASQSNGAVLLEVIS